MALAEGEKIAVAGSGTMTITQDPDGSGTVGIAEAPKGEQTGITVTESIHDGTYQIPYEHLEPVAVTRENMDEVITGKYHEENDIYLNVRN